MKCILFGGSGEVGGAVARELIKSNVCSQLTLLGRRAVATMEDEAKVQQIVVDTNAADFEEVVRKKAQGHEVAISCIGIGSGTTSMTEAQMLEVEVNLLGRFARGCKAARIEIFELLTAVGVNERSADSRRRFDRNGNRCTSTGLHPGGVRTRILFIASGGLMAHRILIRLPQRSHFKTSKPKTRFMSSAQL
jgi:nucleoside-diphosphate-sugar epimerase